VDYLQKELRYSSCIIRISVLLLFLGTLVHSPSMTDLRATGQARLEAVGHQPAPNVGALATPTQDCQGPILRDRAHSHVHGARAVHVHSHTAVVAEVTR
jgi:hypothetical protein